MYGVSVELLKTSDECVTRVECGTAPGCRSPSRARGRVKRYGSNNDLGNTVVGAPDKIFAPGLLTRDPGPCSQLNALSTADSGPRSLQMT